MVLSTLTATKSLRKDHILWEGLNTCRSDSMGESIESDGYMVLYFVNYIVGLGIPIVLCDWAFGKHVSFSFNNSRND